MASQRVDIVEVLNNYIPRLYFCEVVWKPKEEGWITCNTNGASKGNPGHSAYGFCLRNIEGYLLYAKAQSIRLASNMGGRSNSNMEISNLLCSKEVRQNSAPDILTNNKEHAKWRVESGEYPRSWLKLWRP